MLKTISCFFIITYLRHINKILRGKISSNNFKDPVRNKAQKVYLKRKTFERKKKKLKINKNNYRFLPDLCKAFDAVNHFFF